ncbi:MAG: hypothetical protein JO297_14205 [Nitrososphaeraceae archaeon]|nr:hypothetical protein [Nitrososphaeraceae archaeon]
MTQLYECEYCGAKNETDLCPKCKADFDSSIRWFLEEYARGYDAKQQEQQQQQDNDY